MPNIKFNPNSINYIFLALLGLFLIYLHFIFDNKKKEGFISNKENFAKHTGDDIYDDFYASIYDSIYSENDRINYEKKIINPFLKNKTKILDIGSGTGNFVNICDNYKNCSAIGIDKSDSMVKFAKKNILIVHF